MSKILRKSQKNSGDWPSSFCWRACQKSGGKNCPLDLIGLINLDEDVLGEFLVVDHEVGLTEHKVAKHLQ